MSEVKLLPLPEGEAIGWTQAWSYDQMRAYARANMEPLLRDRDALRNRLEDTVRDLTDVKAENERLRAEWLKALGLSMQAQAEAKELRGACDVYQARAERLAEALRNARECGEGGDWQSARNTIDAALDQEGGNG